MQADYFSEIASRSFMIHVSQLNEEIIKASQDVLLLRYVDNMGHGGSRFYVNKKSSFSPLDSSIKQWVNKCPLAKPCGQSDAVFLLSRESIRIWYIFRLTFRLLSDVSYSDECRTKTVLSVCEKNVSAFSCNSEIKKFRNVKELLPKPNIFCRFRTITCYVVNWVQLKITATSLGTLTA